MFSRVLHLSFILYSHLNDHNVLAHSMIRFLDFAVICHCVSSDNELGRLYLILLMAKNIPEQISLPLQISKCYEFDLE